MESGGGRGRGSSERGGSGGGSGGGDWGVCAAEAMGVGVGSVRAYLYRGDGSPGVMVIVCGGARLENFMFLMVMTHHAKYKYS